VLEICGPESNLSAYRSWIHRPKPH